MNALDIHALWSSLHGFDASTVFLYASLTLMAYITTYVSLA